MHRFKFNAPQTLEEAKIALDDARKTLKQAEKTFKEFSDSKDQEALQKKEEALLLAKLQVERLTDIVALRELKAVSKAQKKIKEKKTIIKISPGQALLILIDKYNNEDPDRAYALKQLYLSGVKNEPDRKKLNENLQDSILKEYKIADDIATITEDPTRRYFETQLAFHTLKYYIDTIDTRALEKYFQAIRGFFDEPLMDKNGKPVTINGMSNVPAYVDHKLEGKPFDAKLEIPVIPVSIETFPEYAHAIKSLKTDPIYQENFSPEDLKKMAILVKCSCFAVIRVALHNESLPLNIWGTGFFTPEARGIIRKFDIETVISQFRGIMKSTSPLPIGDVSYASSVAQRAPDKSTYIENAEWTKHSFTHLMHPFVNSISGTLLAQIRMAKRLAQNPEFFELFGDTDKLLNYFRCYISLLGYQLGGHSLYEFYVLFSLPQVREAFNFAQGFDDINMDISLLTAATTPIEIATETKLSATTDKEFKSASPPDVFQKTIGYNKLILKRAKLDAAIKSEEEKHVESKENDIVAAYESSIKELQKIIRKLALEYEKEFQVCAGLIMESDENPSDQLTKRVAKHEASLSKKIELIIIYEKNLVDYCYTLMKKLEEKGLFLQAIFIFQQTLYFVEKIPQELHFYPLHKMQDEYNLVLAHLYFETARVEVNTNLTSSISNLSSSIECLERFLEFPKLTETQRNEKRVLYSHYLANDYLLLADLYFKATWASTNARNAIANLTNAINFIEKLITSPYFTENQRNDHKKLHSHKLANYFMELGNIHINQNDFKKAAECYQKSADILATISTNPAIKEQLEKLKTLISGIVTRTNEIKAEIQPNETKVAPIKNLTRPLKEKFDLVLQGNSAPFIQFIQLSNLSDLEAVLKILAASDKTGTTGWQRIHKQAKNCKPEIVSALKDKFGKLESKELITIGKKIFLALYDDKSNLHGLCKERHGFLRDKSGYGKTDLWQNLIKAVQDNLKSRNLNDQEARELLAQKVSR